MVMHHDRPSWSPIMGEEGEVEEEEDEDRGVIWVVFSPKPPFLMTVVGIHDAAS